MGTIQTSLLAYVNDELLAGAGPDVGPDDEIVLDGTVDSLGVARLVGFIETELGVAIGAEEVTIEHFRTIATLADYVSQRVEADPAA